MKHSTIRRALLLAAAFPLLSFAADGALRIDDPYVRLVPPNAPASAAFMVISNSGSTERQLLKAQSPAAKSVELHTHINDHGVMKMRQVDRIAIKANGQTELKPGSYHIMLIDLAQALNEGDSVPLTLSFDDGSTQQISAPVRRIQAAGAPAPAMDHGAMKH
ncbi:MAG: periplasmic copper chaperone [Proteobacteria bacterium]|nr:periplasmic copper chaperone [Pseudomonadota bacterium]